MKEIVFEKYSPPDVLQLKEVKNKCRDNAGIEIQILGKHCGYISN